MSTMIILQGVSNAGKTTTLRKLAKLLTKQYGKFELIEGTLEEYDFVIKIEANNKVIGIVSMGDNSDLINKLKLIYDKCDDIDLLYGASRTKGETVKIINDISKEKNADIIWTSTYRNKQNREELNSIKAEELYNLSTKLNLI
jgi:ABC-type Na+ transport system ATPase subunit NatA